jgi:hypothetical protein
LGKEGTVKKFKLRYVVECELTVEDLWPDGGAPENPSAIHVRELVRKDGGILEVLNSWNLHQTSSAWDVWEVK